MSDSTQPETLFQLRKPLELVDIVRNDMGEPADYLFRRTDGSEHEVISCGEDYVQRVFVPVGSVDNLKQQIEQLLQSYGARFYADYEVDRVSHREKIEAEEAQGRMESRVRAEFADEVLELFGLENKETEQ